MNELVYLVEQWSKDKGLDQADSTKQFLKVAEEFGEIAAAMARNKHEDLKDAIGDTIVTLIVLSQQQGLTVEECLAQAYGVISKRTGKMVNDVFVKSEDL